MNQLPFNFGVINGFLSGFPDFFYSYWGSLVVLVPAILFTFITSAWVNHTFRKYMLTGNSRRITGLEAARLMLNSAGINDVEIMELRGSAMNNYYDPVRKTLNLSREVAYSRTITAMCVACHEAGHAVQHSRHYVPMYIRSVLVPITNFASRISWTLMIGGLILSTITTYGSVFFSLGVCCFIVAFIFDLCTLPVEFNASHRAIEAMSKMRMVEYEDIKGSKAVLRSAAMTYVASALMSLAALFRVILLSQRR